MNTLVDDIIKHMTPDRAFESHYPKLVSVVNKIIAHMTDFSALFSMVSSILEFTEVQGVMIAYGILCLQDKFLPFIDLFQKEHIKVEVCMNVIRAFTV